jgi:hypothetical protein
VKPNDYVELLSLIDTLAVPVICGGDVSPLNNYDPRSVRVQVFAASDSTRAVVDVVQKRLGRFHTQKTPKDFKLKDIRSERRLVRDPAYVPDYLPRAKATTIEVSLTPEVERMLQTLMATGEYLDTVERALIHTFMRWYEAYWTRDHVSTKLAFRAR